MKKNKILLVSAIVIAAIFVIASTVMKKELKPTQEIYRVSQDKLIKFHNPTTGPQTAKVTIVEFLDPECESCAAFNPTVKGILSEYKNDVRLVVRYMLFHRNSKLAALATEAAGKQGKYWEMQAQLFYQTDWTHQETPQNEKFERIAKEMGLDVTQFKKDMLDPGLSANIEADFQEGPSLGVKGTPTLFVNGRMLPELSYEGLKSLIEEELKLSL